MIFTALLLIVIFSFLVSAQVLGCAEKTTAGAWCQQVTEAETATGFSWAATSCSQTQYYFGGRSVVFTILLYKTSKKIVFKDVKFCF